MYWESSSGQGLGTRHCLIHLVGLYHLQNVQDTDTQALFRAR